MSYRKCVINQWLERTKVPVTRGSIPFAFEAAGKPEDLTIQQRHWSD